MLIRVCCSCWSNQGRLFMCSWYRVNNVALGHHHSWWRGELSSNDAWGAITEFLLEFVPRSDRKRSDSTPVYKRSSCGGGPRRKLRRSRRCVGGTRAGQDDVTGGSSTSCPGQHEPAGMGVSLTAVLLMLTGLWCRMCPCGYGSSGMAWTRRNCQRPRVVK